MDKQSRLTSIVGSVMEHGTIDVETIVRELGVSAATARRDLDSLADQQLLVRTRGGAREQPGHRGRPPSLPHLSQRASNTPAALAA